MQLVAGFKVSDLVAAAAYLEAGSPVCRRAVCVKAQVAFAGYCHTQGSVGEHFHPHQVPGRSGDMLPGNSVADVLHLVQVQFARQHNDIRKLGVELEGEDVGDAQLGGDMHFQAYLAAVFYGRHIGRDDRVHTCGLGCVQGLAHSVKVFLVQDNVKGHIALDPCLAADAAHLIKVRRAEIVGGVGAHIELPHAKVDGVRPALDGCAQAFEVAGRSHYFQFLLI